MSVWGHSMHFSQNIYNNGTFVQRFNFHIDCCRQAVSQGPWTSCSFYGCIGCPERGQLAKLFQWTVYCWKLDRSRHRTCLIIKAGRQNPKAVHFPLLLSNSPYKGLLLRVRTCHRLSCALYAYPATLLRIQWRNNTETSVTNSSNQHARPCFWQETGCLCSWWYWTRDISIGSLMEQRPSAGLRIKGVIYGFQRINVSKMLRLKSFWVNQSFQVLRMHRGSCTSFWSVSDLNTRSCRWYSNASMVLFHHTWVNPPRSNDVVITLEQQQRTCLS